MTRPASSVKKLSSLLWQWEIRVEGASTWGYTWTHFGALVKVNYLILTNRYKTRLYGRRTD
jgi:hypothetical protein